MQPSPPVEVGRMLDIRKRLEGRQITRDGLLAEQQDVMLDGRGIFSGGMRTDRQSPRSPRHWPGFGSAADVLAPRRAWPRPWHQPLELPSPAGLWLEPGVSVAMSAARTPTPTTAAPASANPPAIKLPRLWVFAMARSSEDVSSFSRA
jgi:hypothetical protein